MSLPEFSIKKKVTVYMFTIGLILLGVLSFKRLPQDLFPPITFPQVTIVTDYSNAAPEEIETLITRVVEESIGSVAGSSNHFARQTLQLMKANPKTLEFEPLQ